ncbi:MAG: hypothetical protein LBB88_02485, partial [Planctomycetaceae bacterium]|nr:hypothetical protein [Planctomycetaceae bacterium]
MKKSRVKILHKKNIFNKLRNSCDEFQRFKVQTRVKNVTTRRRYVNQRRFGSRNYFLRDRRDSNDLRNNRD